MWTFVHIWHIKESNERSCFVYLLSDDAHFSTNPKIPGIDLNSVRMFFATLNTPAFSALLEQVLTHKLFTVHAAEGRKPGIGMLLVVRTDLFNISTFQ